LSRNFILFFVIALVFLVGCTKGVSQVIEEEKLKSDEIPKLEEIADEVIDMAKNIQWLGHDSFKISGEKIIYTDPYKIKKEDKADIILITHPHYDHCSPDDVRKIQGEDTIIVTTPDCASKLSGDIKTVMPGDSIEAKGIKIEAVPAYNINKQFHPKANKWVGFIFTANSKRIYLAGDTDKIPEMANLNDVDIALLPVSGTYVMTAEEAAEATNLIKPKLAVPMHYGAGVVGTKADAEKFKELCSCNVEILG